MQTRSRVDTPHQTHYVYTGFAVFNDRTYPSFERLLERIGVASQPSRMTFSVSDEIGDFEYPSGSPNGLSAKRSHLATPWFHRMIADLARFNRAGREPLRHEHDDRSPGQWLEQLAFSRPLSV